MAIRFNLSSGKLRRTAQFQYKPGQAKFQYNADNGSIGLLSPTNTTTPSGAITPAASGIVRGLQPQGGLAFTQSNAEQTNKVLAGAKSFSGAIVGRANKVLAGVKDFVGGLSTNYSPGGGSYSQSVSGAIDFVGALLKQVSHPITGSHSFAGALDRKSVV